jgi:4-methylaminobutanoate oxidase (formaldehyde-forming)
MNSLRMEKAYRHWGHDICDENTPLEAGLGFAVAYSKPVDFIGRAALERQRGQGVRRRLVQFALNDPQPLVYHNEPIWRDGTLVGSVTSGAYGHTVGASLCMGYVTCDESQPADAVPAGDYEIEVACERYAARASLSLFTIRRAAASRRSRRARPSLPRR